MKLLMYSACLRAECGGNVKPQTALGEGLAGELSDRGSTPLISTTITLYEPLHGLPGLRTGRRGKWVLILGDRKKKRLFSND